MQSDDPLAVRSVDEFDIRYAGWCYCFNVDIHAPGVFAVSLHPGMKFKQYRGPDAGCSSVRNMTDAPIHVLGSRVTMLELQKLH